MSKWDDRLQLLTNGSQKRKDKFLLGFGPLQYIEAMDRKKYATWSSITCSSRTSIALTQIWMEENSHPHANGISSVYCEPETAAMFALMAMPWKYSITTAEEFEDNYYGNKS